MADYSKLIALIDEIKNTDSFGEGHADKHDGTISLYWTRAKVVNDLCEAMDSHWDYNYRDNLENKYGIAPGESVYSYDISQADEECILTFLTAVVRKDHFCEGALVNAFEEGHVLRWLERLAELTEN